MVKVKKAIDSPKGWLFCQLNDALSICQEVFLELVAYKDQIDSLQLVNALLSYFQSPKGFNE